MTQIVRIFTDLICFDPHDLCHLRSKTIMSIIVFFQKKITFAGLKIGSPIKVTASVYWLVLQASDE